RSLERVGKALDEWASNDARKNALAGLRSDLDRVCDKLPANDPSISSCRAVFRPKPQAAS
ncbi:MAG: thioredoxin family protein, partial [Casimicrobium sp.]